MDAHLGLGNALSTLLRWGMGHREAPYEGRLEVRGLRGRVEIRRDRWGVPYVDAERPLDAWLALGFCHGSERGGQLEILVRAVRGTLSELVGRDGLPIDRLSRRIGFKRAGVTQLGSAKPAIRDQLEAYVRGLNQALARGPRPHELALLGREPTPWEASDVQGYAGLLCFALASNWDVELMRLAVLTHDGPDALRALDMPYPEDLPPSAAPLGQVGALVDRLGDELGAFAHLLGTGGGSNAWAVAAGKTATGRPMLANDPHLVSALPALMYLARLRAPGLAVAGASWIGQPAFAPGHNGFCAWGATAAHADNTDLFVERLGPGDTVWEGERQVPCKAWDERIGVRGGDDVVERIVVGPRGPLLVAGDDDLVGGALPTRVGARRYALSLAATWLQPRPYEGLYRAHEARSFEEMRSFFAAGVTSTISAVYADEAGHVGWWLAVDLPRRRRGHGLVPQPAWDGGAGWEDVGVPFEALPWRLDPEEGFVATANNQPSCDPDGPYLGSDWLDGYRARRIADRLAARDDWDARATQALQRDTYSLPWERMRDVVLARRPDDEAAEVALAILERWDGRMDAGSAGASVFAFFCVALVDRVVRHHAPRAAAWALGRPFTALLPTSTLACRRMGRVVRWVVEQPPWMAWGPTLDACLAAAVRRLRTDVGPDPAAWTWGTVRPARLHHAIGDQPPLDRIFDREIPGEGDNTTVSQGGLDFAGDPRRQAWMPQLRVVFDVGAWDACRAALAGGQSGNPLSPHYDDQLEAWAGEGIPLLWSEEAVAAATVATQRLVPLESGDRRLS